MDLILWRHAEAEEGAPDSDRKLTARGVKQAQQMAEWLRRRLPGDTLVLASPAKRTQQTARELTESYATVAPLAVGASFASILAAAGWPDAKGAVVVVGHQPALGRTAAMLLAGEEADWSVKKGGIWWFSSRARRGESQIVLRAVMSPELL